MTKPTNTKTGFDNRIVLIQYICAIIVVYIHAIVVQSWSLTREAFPIAVNVQGALGTVWHVAVPSFFFISGYLMFLHFEPKKYPQLVKRRFFSVVIPFFVWQLIFYLLYFAVQQVPFLRDSVNGETMPLSVGYFLKEIFVNDGFAPLWYLRELFYFTLLSIVFYYLLKNKYVGLAVIAALFAVNCFVSFYVATLSWMPMFLTGAFAGMHIKKLGFSGEKKTLKALAALGGMLLPLILYFITDNLLFDYLYRFVAGFAFPAVMATFLRKEQRVPRCFTISLFIYCTHGFVLQAVQKVYLLTLGVSETSALVCYFTAPIITVAIITVIALLMQRFTPHVWRFLNGGRKV